VAAILNFGRHIGNFSKSGVSFLNKFFFVGITGHKSVKKPLTRKKTNLPWNVLTIRNIGI